jgi:alpha-glucosidase
VAWRFRTSLAKPEVTVEAETATLRFEGDPHVWLHEEEGFFSHNERHYARRRLAEVASATLASTPAVVELPGLKVAIADADIEDYPGLWLRGSSGSALEAVFPPYPLEEKLERDRDFKVVKAAPWIARTRGRRSYPWRVLGFAERDADLITNALVYLLQPPPRIADTSWIRPGKVAWDWWNANNLRGVDFEAGVNTRTYEHYVDFAAKHGLEYVILDEGWYPLGNLLAQVPQMDVEHLVRYGRERKVGIIPWVVAKTLEDQLEPALDQFARWGVAGLKVDFMQRDDQKLMQFYHRVAEAAARRKLLLDFHGAIRPAQLTRTWPNVLSTEGVLGLEQLKWSDKSDPEHNVTIPFTRMFVGPFDYTPGAMRNAARRSFAPIFEQPMSLGTRAQQLAMYVVFESPLQMLADSPSNYEAEPEAMEFLGPVPSVWDETRVLDARLGDYVLVARRSGGDWYVGAMTDASARELPLAFDFLPEGRFRMTAYADGVNASRFASDCRKSVSEVSRGDRTTLRLAEGGGFAARLTPVR